MILEHIARAGQISVKISIFSLREHISGSLLDVFGLFLVLLGGEPGGSSFCGAGVVIEEVLC